MFKNILTVLCAVLMTSNAVMANDLHLQLTEKAHEVLEPKEDALTLEDVQSKLVNEQLDIQISYEKLYQAQKKIGEARAQYFPYGAGTVAAMYLLNVWNPLLLVELITSIPSKIYNVKTEKNLAKAQKYNNKALEENIKNQVAHLYFNILKEESVLKLTKLELTLMETLLKVYQERVDLGLSTEVDEQEIQLRILDLRDAYLKFHAYLLAEKAAFNVMIAKSPEEAKVIELQTMSDFLEEDNYQRGIQEMIDMALEKSPELVAAEYLISAARNAKKSTKWSILSFNGIGFGYWGRVQVARSKVEDAKLNKELVKEHLTNQVYVADNALKRSLDFLNSEIAVFEETEFFTETELERFKARDISLDALIEAELFFLKDFKELIIAHYESYIKLNDLERVILKEEVEKKPVVKKRSKVSRFFGRIKNAVKNRF